MWTHIKALIYPNKCILCREILTKEFKGYVCGKCREKVSYDNRCPKCSKPYWVKGERCLYCEELPVGIDTISALYLYKGRYKKAIFRWKYQGIRKYAKGFADELNQQGMIECLRNVDALIPVPISKKRYNKRGFNQAEDLANWLSTLTGKPTYNLLRRVKETTPQSALNYRERSKNILNTIKINEECYDIISKETINVAIIDDIYTTGSTVKECAKILHANYNIKSIHVVVVCIGG